MSVIDTEDDSGKIGRVVVYSFAESGMVAQNNLAEDRYQSKVPGPLLPLDMELSPPTTMAHENCQESLRWSAFDWPVQNE
jgi:hypothetical protein